jgi:hypothetical protein
MQFPVHGQGFLEMAHRLVQITLGLGDGPQVIEVGSDAGAAVDEAIVGQGLLEFFPGQVKAALPVILISRLIEGNSVLLEIHSGLGRPAAAQRDYQHPQPTPSAPHG